MGQSPASSTPAAIAAKRRVDAAFRRKGIVAALLSAVLYGFYTAFMTLGMSRGVWAEWYGSNSGLSPFAVMFLLSAIATATTDSCSALWAIGAASIRGRFTDFLRCIASRPGMIMAGAAIVGGPLASTAYVVGLQKAGSLVVPISALCPAIGAILGRTLFRQQLNRRMLLGIAICFLASAMIGSTSFGEAVPDGLATGMLFGILAALCWGIEGCVCGYGTAMIDPEIGITIRQVTSGLSNMIVLVPLFGAISGTDTFGMVGKSTADAHVMQWFALAGLSSYLAFMCWYKGNAICGAALGMSCNGTFSFWGPLCCWIILGMLAGQDGWSMPLIAWAAAVVMIMGIFTIAMNPLALFRKKSEARA